VQYRTVEQVNRAVVQLLPTLPHDLDIVVAIPRSGLIPATLLALHRNLPLTDVNGLIESRLLQGGDRHADVNPFSLDRSLRVLVVDDSVLRGRAIQRAKSTISAAKLPHDVRYAAVYVSEEGKSLVDHYSEVIQGTRIFEWNLMHSYLMPTACVDIDGVLCPDPTDEENDDGDRYLSFLANAPPRIIPKVRVGWLVTSRLERYRKETEAWLSRHGVEYGELVMSQWSTAVQRRAAGDHAVLKANTYRSTDARLFIESSERQAREIMRLTSKPVYCVETNALLTADDVPADQPKESVQPSWLIRRFQDAKRAILGRA